MKKIYQSVFLYAMYLSYLLYFIVLFGLFGYAPQYLEFLRTFLKFYIAIILIVLYNPFNKKGRELEKFDKKIIFSCAVFLLLSTSLTQGIEEYIVYETRDLIKSRVKIN